MVKKYLKRCSISLAIWEMQIKIKTTMSYHYTPIRMVKTKNNDNTKC